MTRADHGCGLSAGSAVPEIIPPVTQTQGRTVPPVAATSAKLLKQDVKDSDFVPRMTITQSNAAAAQHASKPKRYSTQRQRLAADADTAGDMSYDIPNTDAAAAQSLASDRTYYGTQNLIVILELLEKVYLIW